MSYTPVLEEEGVSAGELLGHPEPDPLVPLDQLYQLVPEQLVEHRVEALELGQPEQIPLELVIKIGAGLEQNTKLWCVIVKRDIIP